MNYSDQLTEQFVLLTHLMMHRHHQHHQGPHSRFRGQGRILSILNLEPKMSQKKLSFLLGIRPQSIGELLTKLEQNEFITRRQSDEDRRSMIVSLTDKGREAAVSEQCLHESEKKTEQLFSCLTEDEQLQLTQTLEKIIGKLKESMPPEEANCPPHPMMHHHHGHFHDHHHHCPQGNFEKQD